MIIGERLRVSREEKKFSQGDIEKKTGLLRCYVSRVENGHTVPSVETLEKMARALEIPMYKLFYDAEEPPKLPNLLKRKSAEDILWGSSGEDANMLAKFCRLFGRMKDDHRNMLFFMTQKMAKRKAV
jgi:transcriptional regulator with XRE-family HTH domain